MLLLVLALVLASVPAHATTTAQRTEAAGLAMSSHGDPVYVAAEIELPDLGCGPHLLASLPTSPARSPQLALWVGLFNGTGQGALVSPGLRAGIVFSCASGQPRYELAYEEEVRTQAGSGGLRRARKVFAAPHGLTTGDHVSIVLHADPERPQRYGVSWQAVTDSTPSYWSREALLAPPSALPRTAGCLIELLDSGWTSRSRSTAGSVRVEHCSTMTVADAALVVSDLAGSTRTRIPLDGAPATAQTPSAQQYVVAGPGAWAAAPRLLPAAPDATEGPQAFELRYQIPG